MDQLVSIVMPVYNGEKYIYEAIISVISQTYENWELVIIDDGSSDRTSDIISNIRDKRVRYYFQENKGQAAALNHGLDVIRGDYYTVLDADDSLTEDSLQCRVTFLIQHPDCDALYSDGFFCDEYLKPVRKFSDMRINNTSSDVYGDYIAETLVTGGGTVMIRRDAILKNQLRYDETIFWCQDLDFLIRTAEHCKFGMVNQVTVMYRIHNHNMTLSTESKRQRDSLIQTKFKVLRSPKLTTVPIDRKFEYFRKFFVDNLHKCPEYQDQVLNSLRFRELPRHMQSRLLRYAASKYLVEEESTAQVEKFYQTSLKIYPKDHKSRILFMLFSIHPKIAKSILQIRKNNSTTQSLSLFINHN